MAEKMKDKVESLTAQLERVRTYHKDLTRTTIKQKEALAIARKQIKGLRLEAHVASKYLEATIDEGNLFQIEFDDQKSRTNDLARQCIFHEKTLSQLNIGIEFRQAQIRQEGRRSTDAAETAEHRMLGIFSRIIDARFEANEDSLTEAFLKGHLIQTVDGGDGADES